MTDTVYHLVCHNCAFERVHRGALARVARDYLDHRAVCPGHDVEFAAIGDVCEVAE